jgi:hypothetical protein
MSVAERDQDGGTLALHEIYIVELREHALVLIWLGYRRMQQTDFSTAEEDDITGELARHMDEITQAEDAPPWAERYTVKEQIRSHTSDRLGKRRPIVDVEFERHKRGIRPRLRFEAKRLGRGVGVGDYLGSEGLGAFLDCYYSRTHNEAGMLAYIQDGAEQEWAEKLAAGLISSRHRILQDGGWEHLTITDAPPHTYRTVHTDKEDTRLLVLHVLLSFSRRQ